MRPRPKTRPLARVSGRLRSPEPISTPSGEAPSRQRSTILLDRTDHLWWLISNIVVLLVEFGIIYLLSATFMENVRLNNHTHEVIDSVDLVLSAVKDAETGQRGYLLTGQQLFLEPFNEASGEIPRGLEELAKMTADNTSQKSQVDDLRATISAKMTEINRTIQMNRVGNRAGAISAVSSGIGKQMMDRIRAIARTLKAEETVRSNLRIERSVTVTKRLVFGAFFGAGLLLALLCVGTQSIHHTIRVQNKTQKALLKKAAQLRERSVQLKVVNQELEEFAYVASHDLKAPLRVIDNASKWLEEDLQEHLTEETRENMNLLRNRVRRMDKLLDDLLEYARIGRVRDQRYLETVNGDELMDNVLALLPATNFTLQVSPSFTDIRVRRMPLQQILVNLISNAIKHHDKITGNVEVTVQDDGDCYTFAVKDDGPGIPLEFHDQIFKMFQTLRSRDQAEGSGMGLAMVRKNAEVFGGTLQLVSAEGKGSTFRLTWPKKQQLSREAA